MKVKDTFGLIILVALLWTAVCFVRPYWDKYSLGQDIEAAAVYGTKRSIAETKRFLTKKMKEKGWEFQGEDFIIEKSRRNRVTITVDYEDEVRVFGVLLKELSFTVKKTVSEVESIF